MVFLAPAEEVGGVQLAALHAMWSLFQTANVTFSIPAAVMLLWLYCCAQKLICFLQSLSAVSSADLVKAVVSACTPCLTFNLEHLHLLTRVSR